MILEIVIVKIYHQEEALSIDVGEFTTSIDFYTVSPEPALEPSINVDTADFSI